MMWLAHLLLDRSIVSQTLEKEAQTNFLNQMAYVQSASEVAGNKAPRHA